MDAQSFDGKVVGGVLARAAELGKPALVVVGRVDPELDMPGLSGSVTVVSLLDRFGEERAMADAPVCAAEIVSEWLASDPQ